MSFDAYESERNVRKEYMTTLHEVSSEIAGFTLEASFSEIGFLGLTSDFCDSVLTMFLVIATKDYLSPRPQSLLKWCQEY